VLTWPALRLAATGLCLAGCDRYTAEPAFCDDWCHATLTPGCDDDPAGCVSECERNRATPACQPLQETLLACYQQEKESLFCETNGGGRTRVADGACEGQRDAWFSCEAPEMGPCLSTCRMQQPDRFGAPPEAPPSEALGMPSEPPTASAVDIGSELAKDLLDRMCVSLDYYSCEETCWRLVEFSEAFTGRYLSPDAALGYCYLTGYR
jgi:hypothetical protein